MTHRCLLLKLLLLCSAGSLTAAVRIVPTPQYAEPLKESVSIAPGARVLIVLGPAKASGSKRLRLAADFVRRELEAADSSVRVEVEGASAGKSAGPHIYLWDYSLDRKPGAELSFLDREVLTDADHFGQSYVIRTPDKKSMWVVGSTEEGVLLGTMSVLQLIQKASDGVELSGAYIRDYPDFRYRAAADWLLNAESNRWALERGQGIEGYKRLCERKLDEALRYKINMVVFDGFGWGLKERFTGYAEMMRSLNQYARARDIKLLYGGYGASYGITYQTGPLYESQSYLGQVFKNRESYPDGSTYECMGFPRAKKGVNPRILGSCRANDDLNKLKGDEIRKFVEAVEPGALYIHHEDFGGAQGTEAAWQQRCDRCRKRWPNNSLVAPDGGAGGLAHGYSALIQAVNSVKNPADGYDAARDCLIILVSPVYHADSRLSEDWSKVLELWKNIGLQLPPAKNVQVCFREIFPEEYGGETWMNAFNSVMRNAGLHLGTYLYFLGGADNYSTDNPLSAAPAMNALFRGATGMYNFSGDFYEEPMELINAEYCWNMCSTGFFRNPTRYSETVRLWRQFMSEEGEPPELFGAGGIYEAACNLLYGPQAGPIMASYYRESAAVPNTQAESTEHRSTPESIRTTAFSYLPMVWDRVYAIPRHWRDLALDAQTWSAEITNERYVEQMARQKLTPEEVHHRLVRRWTVLGELNGRGARDVDEALQDAPRPSSIEDLQFLKNCFAVDQPLMEALADFHRGMEKYLASPQGNPDATQDFQKALAEATRAHDLAMKSFGPPIDPAGGETGAIQSYSGRLTEAIQDRLKHVGEPPRVGTSNP
jgi:hypothetical protein